MSGVGLCIHTQSSNTWECSDAEEEDDLYSRYAHSTIVYDSKIYLLGEIHNKTIIFLVRYDLWLFNMFVFCIGGYSLVIS